MADAHTDGGTTICMGVSCSFTLLSLLVRHFCLQIDCDNFGQACKVTNLKLCLLAESNLRLYNVIRICLNTHPKSFCAFCTETGCVGTCEWIKNEVTWISEELDKEIY